MWSQIKEYFKDLPAQQRVAQLLFERGFQINKEGKVVSGNIEIPHTQIGKEVGVSMTVIDAEPFTDGGRLKALAEAINVDAECYGRLDWTDFMDKIRECRVAIELDYVGICRVAYECAKVNVPMVGTNLAEYRNILFPDLTFEPDDLDGMAQKIKEIYIKEPRKIIRDGRTMAEEYFSEEACRARLFELFEEIGYEHS